MDYDHDTAELTPVDEYDFAKVQLDESAGFVEHFQQYLNGEISDLIVDETNPYAIQFPRTLLISKPGEIDGKEPMTFFTRIILQGVIEKPDVKSYWLTREVLSTPAFGDVMGRDCFFMLIMNLLHLTDNEAPVNGHPKLRKHRLVLIRLTEKFRTLYTPEQNVSVGERLLCFKGRLSWKQHMPVSAFCLMRVI
ncbi:hypothetical protein IscW_ISCW000490 [Ixodes scapularis]|uniref:PiggyBac transposable element-derived protein domain-containing protein n=1 Tax=Ixodes scapularis TaxID=6945 RepID=B7P702_IXOSC|nr:hypothetical protein IscW_ISCW000490 [Ixodes scapularis]|eukprot:XP_002409427.1 hypothetical protein IscW_ISCW000490 [Ixodes scapularis]